MARRQATLRLAHLAEVLSVWNDQLAQGAVVVPPHPTDGSELAGEFRLDLVLPLVGRQGPIVCQIVQRMPDGSVAARIPEMPDKIQELFQSFQVLFDEARALLLERGELGVAAASEDATPEAVEPTAGSDVPQGSTAEASAVQLPPRRAGPRGYPIPALSGLSPSRSGRLDDRSLRGGLLELSVQGGTGVLVVSATGQPVRYGYFDGGGPVGWRNEPAISEETLGALMVRSNLLAEGQDAQVYAYAERHGLRLGETLIALGLVQPDQLAAALSQQVEFQLKQALVPRPGEWSFYELSALPAADFGSPPLHVLSTLHRALVNHARTLPARNVQAAIQPRLQLFPDVAEAYRGVVGRGAWTRVEQDILLAMRRKPAKLVDILKLDPTGIEGPVAVLALMELGVVTLSPVAPKGASAGDEAVAERIRSKRARSETDNYFDILEMHWISTAGDLDAAYEKIRNEFSRNAYVQLGSELIADVDAIAGQIQLAYNNLRDETRRRRYRAEIIDADLMARVSEELAQRGDAAIAAKNRELAIDCWGKAQELNPEDRRFKDGLKRAQSMR